MKRIVYIIPGFGESNTRQPSYKKVAKLFLAQKIQPIHVQIDWLSKKPMDFNDYVNDFLRQFKKPKNAQIYILGFSFGAVLGFLTAPKARPDALILCSLSPIFEEDLKTSRRLAWRKWWENNFKDSDFIFDDFAQKIKSRTYVMVGGKEKPEVLKRARGARRKIKTSRLIIIDKAKHDLNQKEYLQAVKKIISTL